MNQNELTSTCFFHHGVCFALFLILAAVMPYKIVFVGLVVAFLYWLPLMFLVVPMFDCESSLKLSHRNLPTCMISCGLVDFQFRYEVCANLLD